MVAVEQPVAGVVFVLDGVLIGAILIGWPDLIEPVSKAVKAKKALNGATTQLKAGDWSCFSARGN